VGEDTMQGAIQALAERADIARRVTFHGFRPSDALVPFYQQAHLSVLTSRHEAASVVALEAAACGTPTVGTNVGYLSDWAPGAAGEGYRVRSARDCRAAGQGPEGSDDHATGVREGAARGASRVRSPATSGGSRQWARPRGVAVCGRAEVSERAHRLAMAVRVP